MSHPLFNRLLCGLTAAVLACSVAAQPVGLPSMGSASSAQLSPQLERTLGEAIMEQGRRDPTYINDPDVSQYLQSLGAQLAAATPGSVSNPEVFAIRDPQINAFALPGGYVGLHSGLVTTAENESQLASVLAHELGHIMQRHVARGMTQQDRSNHIMIASIAGALLAALAGSGDLAMGAAAFGQAAAIDRQLGFSRQAEQEADRIGLQTMARAGFDPRGMVQMFGHLSNVARLNQGTGGGAYTSTHPLSIQRMSDIENRVQAMPPVSHQDSDSFWYVRAKLRLLQANSNQLMQSAKSALRLEASKQKGVRQSAAWYGLAYAALRQKNYAEAADLLKKAQAGGRDSPEITGLAIQIALKQEKTQEAVRLAEQGVQRWPDSLGVALGLAEALQQAGQTEAAVKALQKSIKKWPDEAVLYQHLGQNYERLDKPVEARRAMADYYEKIGALPTAVEHLQQARALSNDFYTQSQLDVQIRTLKEKQRSSRDLLERFR